MSKKKEYAVENWGFVDIDSICIQLNKHEIEENEFIYGVTLFCVLEFKDDKPHKTFILNTQIGNECRHCACREAIEFIEVLTDNIFRHVIVFNAEGEEIVDEAFTIEELYEEEAEGEYDLANMEAGKPVIMH